MILSYPYIFLILPSTIWASRTLCNLVSDSPSPNETFTTVVTQFSEGLFAKKDLIQTLSSAIDIVIPYNFWRFLYFSIGSDGEMLKRMMDEFNANGVIELDAPIIASIQQGFKSASIGDEETAQTIRQTFNRDGYLLDPHTAVAVAAASRFEDILPSDCRIVCLATAHPAKFPDITRDVLGCGSDLPEQGKHETLERAAKVCQQLRICDLEDLEFALVEAIETEMENR